MEPRPLGSSPRNSWRVSEAEADLARTPAPPRPVRLQATPRLVKIDLARTACIVIDMQNDFCAKGGWLHGIGVDVAPASTPIAPLNALLPALRASDVPIVWVNWGNRPDRLNLSPSLHAVYDPLGIGAGLGGATAAGTATLEKDSWGAAIVDGLCVEPTDIFVDKYRMSGFWDTALDSILRNLGITTLLFAGVNSDQCVMCTLQDANFLGYDCLLLDDCAATTSPPFCAEATRYNINQCFGFITTSTALAIGLQGDPAE